MERLEPISSRISLTMAWRAMIVYRVPKQKERLMRELVTISLFKEGVNEDTNHLTNITDKILLPLKFELTQKSLASKSYHC